MVASLAFTLNVVSTPPLVEFSNVGFSTSGITILHDVDLTMSPGDVLGVSGPNGSGKTTLLRLLATLLRPSTGTWTTLGVSEHSPRQAIVRMRPAIALLGHTPAVWPELTLRENVDIVEGLAPSDGDLDPLSAVGLAGAADRRAEQASLGMLRRVEFARVLRRVPKLLLLDEAHAGLDAAAAEVVAEAVRRVTSCGGAAVMVSHEPARINELTTRTARIDSGNLVEDAL